MQKIFSRVREDEGPRRRVVSVGTRTSATYGSSPLNADSPTLATVLARLSSFHRDEYFELSVLMRLMSKRTLDLGCVAGCTVAFPMWWRVARGATFVLFCAFTAYCELFKAEITVSSLAGVLLDPVRLVLFILLLGSITAFGEACVYPTRASILVARDATFWASFTVAISSYIFAGWKASGMGFLTPGILLLIACLAHFNFASCYKCDLNTLTDKLGSKFSNREMGWWLYNKDSYPPAGADLEEPRWNTVRKWICEDAGYTFRNTPKLTFQPNIFPPGFKLRDRPVVVGDLGIACPVSSESVGELLNSKVPLVLKKEEEDHLRSFNESDEEKGQREDLDRYLGEVMEYQPRRQANLRYNIFHLGAIVDAWPLLYEVRRSTVTTVAAVLASAVTVGVPSAGSKIVGGSIALILAYYSDAPAISRWCKLQFKLLRRNAGVASEEHTTAGLFLVYAACVVTCLGKMWPTDAVSGEEKLGIVWMIAAGVSPIPGALATIVGHCLESFWLRREEGFWIQPNGRTHGYDIFMKARSDWQVGFKHFCFQGDAFVVGKDRLMFSHSGRRLETRRRVGQDNDQSEDDFHVDRVDGSRLVQVG